MTTARARLRILHVLGSLDPGGVEVWLLNLLRNIDRDRFQFDFCTFGPEPGLHAAEAERLGSRVYRCPKGANPWEFGKRFRRIVRGGEYDVVHSHVHFFSGAVLRWASAEGVPVRIAHSHTSQDDRPDVAKRRGYRWLMRSWIHRYATNGLAASRPAAGLLFGDSWKTDRRFRVLHCGIDLSPFQETVDANEVRGEVGIPTDASVVGHVGRFTPAKNHQFFLQIAAEIVKTRPDVHFLLIGDGPLRSRIENQAKRMGFNGNMHFAGSRTDVPRLLRGAMDAFVFPSLWEGLPTALIEAQAAGLPCVISDSVTSEADVLIDSISRLPVAHNSEEWAVSSIQAIEKGRKSDEFALKAIRETDLCIARTGLLNFYSGLAG